MISPAAVSAVIPTRGDHDLSEIIGSLAECAEVIVWDNSVEEDLKVYGRYAAIERASMQVIYTQDDDCIIDVAEVCAAYRPGVLVANMPIGRWDDYFDSALVGWGSVFDRELPARAFDRFAQTPLPIHAVVGAREQRRRQFQETCDVVFSALTPCRKIDVGFRHLPWAEGPGRMFTTDPRAHKEGRDRMLALARQARRNG